MKSFLMPRDLVGFTDPVSTTFDGCSVTMQEHQLMKVKVYMLTHHHANNPNPTTPAHSVKSTSSVLDVVSREAPVVLGAA
jgi:hypothetical protein